VEEYFAHEWGFSNAAMHLKEHKSNVNGASDHFLHDEANLPHVDGCATRHLQDMDIDGYRYMEGNKSACQARRLNILYLCKFSRLQETLQQNG
jgi:hypothetical protein